MKDYFEMFNNSPAKAGVKDVVESSWKSPSNIALIKYWGKKKGQLPANASLSMTLDKAATYAWVRASVVHPGKSRLKNSICTLNNDPNHPFIPKLQNLYLQLTKKIPLLAALSLDIRTENSFPHSTGIASSASGISAFTFCLLDIVAQFNGINIRQGDFYRAVSYASRLGSGSACRSAYGGFTVWGKTPALEGSSNYEAVPINDIVSPFFLHMQDAILVVSSQPKRLASSRGHQLMEQHPFAGGRYKQAGDNISSLLKALNRGDFDLLASIAENEALSLHALLMTSCEEGFMIHPGSVSILQKIRQARKQGLPVFFTLDAGPNIHMLFPQSHKKEVEEFTRKELLFHCENGKIIFDSCGEGPLLIKKL